MTLREQGSPCQAWLTAKRYPPNHPNHPNQRANIAATWAMGILTLGRGHPQLVLTSPPRIRPKALRRDLQLSIPTTPTGLCRTAWPAITVLTITTLLISAARSMGLIARQTLTQPTTITVPASRTLA